MKVLPDMQSVDAETGEPADKKILEDAGVAFDPYNQHLDLSKEEKRRTTALMMAIQAYNNLIIKDAEMYIAVSRDAGKDGLPPIKPATIDAMVEASWKFEDMIAGRRPNTNAEPERPVTADASSSTE